MSAPHRIISFHVHNRQLENARAIEHSQPWQSLPPFLTVAEVTEPPAGSLPENDIRQPYLSKDHYLSTIYALTRFEASQPLRKAIAAYKAEGLPTDEFFIFSKVFVRGYALRPSGATARLSFSTQRLPEDLDWKQCKLLKQGTLLALSPEKDRFQKKCILAIVDDYRWEELQRIDEDAERPTTIDVLWTHPDTAIVDGQEYVMIEAKNGYFESKWHTLVGLQHAALERSKFDRHLVQAEKTVRERPTGDLPLPSSSSTFDESQREAFNVMVERELALVQGPPGTGKTFTTVVSLEHLVNLLRDSREREAPIIVASQTNHATDQLLKLCSDREIGEYVRLGGQSKSETIKEHSMFNLRSVSKFKTRNKSARNAQEDVAASLKSCVDDISCSDVLPAGKLLEQGLITLKQFESLEGTLDGGDDDWTDGSDSEGNKLSKWLGKDRDKIMAQLRQRGNEPEPDKALELTQDDEMGDVPGEFVPISHSLAGDPQDDTIEAAKRELLRHSDLWSITPRRRVMVYEYLHYMVRRKAASRFQNLLEKYEIATKDVKMARWESDCRIIQKEGIDIIGCTTTGLSKYRGFLAALQPKVLVIEEAAETQEAPIAAALFESLERVILVGDHQQLAPHVDVSALGEAPYHLNVSLFERLVSKVGLPYAMLKVQRRMAPDIREMVQTFYPLLRDHESVKEREAIPGMGDVRLWWFEHTWPERRNKDMSYLNMDEASMILYFIKHLLRNGLGPGQITVLSYYKGQVDLIKSQLLTDEDLATAYPNQEWSVRTVDGFQGEENEVILLSIVRGPSLRYNAGFVRDENRAVVAVSRARRGCFIFGNTENLLQADKDSRQTWQKVIDVLSVQKRIGQWLPIQCTEHGNQVDIEDVEHWFDLQGGCLLDCTKKCSRGHNCRLKCHPRSSTSCACALETCPNSKIPTICSTESMPIEDERPKSGPREEKPRGREGRRAAEAGHRPAKGGKGAKKGGPSRPYRTVRGGKTRSPPRSSGNLEKRQGWAKQQKQQNVSQDGTPTPTGGWPDEPANGGSKDKAHDLITGDEIRRMGYESYEQALALRARQAEGATAATTTDVAMVPTTESNTDGTGQLIDFSDSSEPEDDLLSPEREDDVTNLGPEEDLISFEND